METSAATDRARLRVLGLGNDLLADDAFGIEVARRVRRALPDVEAIESSEAGLALLDHISGARRLIIVDTIRTGGAPPGTLYALEPAALGTSTACAPHGAGLLEILQLAQCLDMGDPEEVLIIAVEAADCTTIGGPMHPAVKAAIPAVLQWIRAAATGAPLKHPGCARPERSPR